MTGTYSGYTVTSEGWYWNITRKEGGYKILMCTWQKPWVHLLPSPPPFRMSSPSTWMRTFFTFLTCRLHPSYSSVSPSPTLLLSFCPLYTDFPSLPATPHPPIPGSYTHAVLWRSGLCSITLAVEKDVTGKKSSRFQYAMSYPWTRDMGKDGEVRHKDEIPSSPHPSIPYQPSVAFLSSALLSISLPSSLSLHLPVCPLGEDRENTEISMSSYIPPSRAWLLVHPESISICSL